MDSSWCSGLMPRSMNLIAKAPMIITSQAIISQLITMPPVDGARSADVVPSENAMNLDGLISFSSFAVKVLNFFLSPGFAASSLAGAATAGMLSFDPQLSQNLLVFGFSSPHFGHFKVSAIYSSCLIPDFIYYSIHFIRVNNVRHLVEFQQAVRAFRVFVLFKRAHVNVFDIIFFQEFRCPVHVKRLIDLAHVGFPPGRLIARTPPLGFMPRPSYDRGQPGERCYPGILGV